MTWNLQRGQAVAGRIGVADMAPFAARITANRADVVGLQEVTRQQATALAGLLGWGSPRYVETKNPCPDLAPPVPGTCVPFGNAIVSRHPLGDAEIWSLPASALEAAVEARVLLRSVADVGGVELSVYVTHLASEATAAEREAQVAAALAFIDDDRPDAAVLLGDLNAGPFAGVVGLVTERFVDAWAEVRGGDAGFTSNATLTLNRRIDYVFVDRTSDLHVTAASVDPEVLSDHLPVVAELS